VLIKPKKVRAGDCVATVSPSWGGAGNPDLRWRYEQGVKRLEEIFGLKVIPMPNSLKGEDYLYKNPKARAEDLMTAFRDKSIKGIIANVGGDDSIRLLPYINFDVIRENPKIFMGYSDVTVSHLFCHKAGISSFYGPAILTDFAENIEMSSYTIEMVNRILFSNQSIGNIQPANEWTSERLEWVEENKYKKRRMQKNSGYELLQGSGTVQGRLNGGCIEVLEFVKGIDLWPEEKCWENSILFFETSEDKPVPDLIRYWLRNYATQNILQKANGIIFGKPQDEKYYNEYKEQIQTVVKEFDLEELPILYNLNFGHTEPKFILPYGALAEINCDAKAFAVLESGVN